MNTGSCESRLDAKGRLFIPAHFRERLLDGGGEVVLKSGLDGCLELLAPAAWAERNAAIKKLPRVSERMRRLQRVMQFGKRELALDKLGRLTIPIELRRQAGLTRNVVLYENAGVVEIWDSRRWQDYWSGPAGRTAEELLEEVGETLPEELRSKL